MPVVGEFHTFYWENSDTNVTPILTPPPLGGYPTWQSVVTVGSGFGGLEPFYTQAVDAVKWFWTLFRRSRRMDRRGRAAVLRTIDAVQHPAYPLAYAAVKQTATTLGFNRPDRWTELSRGLKRDPGTTENMYRHLEACRLLKANLLTSSLTNPETNLIVELAYQAYAATKGR